MTFKFKTNENERHIVITKETYVALKQMDASLNRLIQGMTTFHYIVGDVISKIRDADPTIDDADLT